MLCRSGGCLPCVDAEIARRDDTALMKPMTRVGEICSIGRPYEAQLTAGERTVENCRRDVTSLCVDVDDACGERIRSGRMSIDTRDFGPIRSPGKYVAALWQRSGCSVSHIEDVKAGPIGIGFADGPGVGIGEFRAVGRPV